MSTSNRLQVIGAILFILLILTTCVNNIRHAIACDERGGAYVNTLTGYKCVDLGGR